VKKYPGFRDGASKRNARFQRISCGIARMSGGGLIVSNCHGGGILGGSLKIALGITFMETWLSTRVPRKRPGGVNCGF